MNENEVKPADEGAVDEAVSDADPLLNVKSEFARKMENLEAAAKRDKEAVEQKLEQILSMVAPKAQAQPTQNEDIKSLMFEDPEKAVQIIQQRAVESATSVVAQQQAIQSKVYEMQSQFPEFAQGNSEAIQLATKHAAKLPPALRGTADGMEIAMLKAVADLGLVPVSKRSQKSSNNDDFSLSGSSSGGGSSNNTNRKSKDKEISQDTLDVARLLDPNFDKDPKRIENLKKANQRPKWNKYS